jgi:hypothetical protein
MTQRLFGQLGRAWGTVFAVAVLCLMAAGPGWAQTPAESASPSLANLLANPNFEKDTEGWSGLPALLAYDADSGAWSSSVTRTAGPDIAGSPAAGSLELRITADQGRCIQAIQCVALTGGTYQLSGQVYLQPGFHTKGGWVGMTLYFMENPDCSWTTAPLADVQANPSIDPALATPETWIAMTAGPLPVPAATHSAQITLVDCVPPGLAAPETVAVNFTHLSFKPVAAESAPKE